MSVWQWFKTLLSGKPHFTIGEPSSPYMRRWYVIPRNHWFNIYLHHIMKSDDDRALHDHPWNSLSLTLAGDYLEHQAEQPPIRRRRFSLVYRKASDAHRLELPPEAQSAWTLFMTGRVLRVWGFHCPTGWIPWTQYVEPLPGGNKVGRGCGEQGG